MVGKDSSPASLITMGDDDVCDLLTRPVQLILLADGWVAGKQQSVLGMR